MMLEIPLEVAVSALASVFGIIAMLLTNNVRLESKNIKVELDMYKLQYDKDLRSNLESHSEIWKELKERRQETADLHSALIKLTVTIEHHNELLVGLKEMMTSVVSKSQCEHVHKRLEDRIGIHND